MTERFLKAVEDTLLHEGGFNDIREDKGGATNWGVSLRFLKTINRDVDGDGDVDWLDVKKLKKEEAIDIYWDNFWRPLYDKLPARLGAKTFDTAVNAGHHRAHVLLQRAIAGAGALIQIDGMPGSQTITAALSLPEEKILAAYSAEQLKFYLGLVEAKPDQVKFINGWTRRANWVPRAALYATNRKVA